MTKLAAPLTAIMSALPVPSADGTVPEWVHIVPREIVTRDGRGPYLLGDAQAVIDASMADRRVVVDENHSTEKLGKQGLPSPARGYVQQMEAREDGIWARIDWTEAGHALMADRAYWGVSPVFRHTKDGRVVDVISVALTNTPNLRGLAALNSEQESEMEELLAKLKQMLGLGEDADESDIWSALGSVMTVAEAERAKNATAIAEMSEVSTALGLESDADVAAILTAAQSALAERDETITALQSELADVAGQVKTLTETSRREKATAFVDGAITAGRVGVKPMRTRYVAMHMADPTGTEELINAMPLLTASHTTAVPPQAAKRSGDMTPREIAMQAEQYRADQAAKGFEVDLVTAVNHVMEN